MFLPLLFRYCLEKEDANDYVLCDVIGQTGADNQWKRECFRVVGDNEKPLMLQSLWKPKEGFSRRFEIQLRMSVEEQSLKDRDTVTAGIHGGSHLQWFGLFLRDQRLCLLSLKKSTHLTIFSDVDTSQ